MASNAESDWIVRRAALTSLDGGDFVDAALTREAVENARHLLDSHGQVLACWIAESTDTMDVLDENVVAGTRRTAPVLELGPFPLRIRSDGWSHGIVVDLYVKQAKAESTWGVQIDTQQPDLSVDPSLSTSSFLPNAWAYAPPGLGPEWITTTTSLHLDPSQVRDAVKRLDAPAVEGSSDRVATDVVLAWVRISVSATAASDAPVLMGYRVREFDTADWP